MAAAYDNLARKLTVIPASTQEATKVRVAAYCRVSTDSDDQLNSFAAQNTYYTTLFSTKENWTMVDIYADEGITGTSAEKREDFQRLMSDCRKGQIDKIYTKSISRFARNTKDCLEATRELKAMGIGVVFEEQHIDTSIVSGEMLTAVFAACAQAESESLSKNLRWSIQKRMENGTYNTCRAGTGFILSKEGLSVQQEAVPVIQHIFHSYLNGMSPKEIAQKLTEKHALKKTWSRKCIEYILQNERYAGNALLQKTYTTSTIPRISKPNKGEMPMYFIQGSNPAMIDQMYFDQATKLRESRKHGYVKRNSCFAKKTFCEKCGSLLLSKNVRDIWYWVCRNHWEKAEKCSLLPIKETEVINAFLRFYYKLKNQGMEILAEMAEDLETVRERQMLWRSDIIELNKRISTITSQSHKLALLNKQRAVDSDIFISKTNQLAEQLRKVKREKEKLLQQQEDDTLRKTREIIDILDCGPDYLDSFDEELFHELIEKIIVESNERIRFRLKNGLELPEYIERTVR